MEKKTGFRTIIEYINSLKKGNKFTFNDVREYLDNNKVTISHSTLSLLIYKFFILKNIEKQEKYYIKIQDIDNNLTQLDVELEVRNIKYQQSLEKEKQNMQQSESNKTEQNPYTVWSTMVEYINLHKFDIITRQKMMLYIRNHCNIPFSEHYIDTLRNQLEKVGYISKVTDEKTGKIKLGQYKVDSFVDNDLTVNQLRVMYEIMFKNEKKQNF